MAPLPYCHFRDHFYARPLWGFEHRPAMRALRSCCQLGQPLGQPLQPSLRTLGDTIGPAAMLLCVGPAMRSLPEKIDRPGLSTFTRIPCLKPAARRFCAFARPYAATRPYSCTASTHLYTKPHVCVGVACANICVEHVLIALHKTPHCVFAPCVLQACQPGPPEARLLRQQPTNAPLLTHRRGGVRPRQVGRKRKTSWRALASCASSLPWSFP
jgi:hypothetical protein